ncbi:MAG: (Fe-S)-binding protein, partial [Archaeoglobaceae archaeon]
MKDQIKLSDVLKEGQLLKIGPEDLIKLPNYDFKDEFKEINPEWKKYVFELDGFIGIDLEWKPKNKEEENELLLKFTEGLKKLLSEENNWTFLYPLLLSLDYCTRCKSCSSACHVYLASGKKEIYRPTFRSEILRRIIKKSKFGKKLFGSLDVNKN